MDAWAAVGWWLLGALVVAPLGLKVLGYVFREVRFQTSRATDAVAQHFPSTVRDWLPAVLYLVLVGTFALILHFPAQAPWGYIADPARADEVRPLPLLGAAAGLIALLTFAASHLKDVDKSAQAGELYLGRNLATYLPLRSWWIRVLPRPFFATITLTLFLIPLVLGALPQTEDAGAEPYLLWAHFSLHQLATALWCACFAVVAAVLLLNLFSVLGNAPNVALRPNWIRRRIARDLQRRTRQEFAHLRSLDRRDQRHEAEAWAARHLQSMARLPTTEHETYLHRSIASISILGAQEAERARILRSGRRLTKRRGTERHAPNESPHAASSWFHARRHEALRRDLDREERIEVGFVSAALRALASGNISPGARNTLNAMCLRAAATADRLHVELVALQRGELTTWPADGVTSIAMETMLATPNDIDAHLGGHLRTLGWQEREEAQVLKVAGLVFERLTPLVFDADAQDEVASSSSRTAEELIDSANRLTHASTRERALSTVADAAVRFATTSSNSSTDAAQTSLRWKVEGPNRTWSAAARDLQKSDIALAIESAAASQLVSGIAPAEAQISRLLELIDDWRIPASLLHHMYYGRRSHTRLTSNQQHAFASALRRMPDSDDETGYHPENIAGFLTSSGTTGHFVSGDGVRWLLEARKKTLSLELCADFIRQADRRLFSDFHFADFLIWHLLSARIPIYAEHFRTSLSRKSKRAAKSLGGERREIQLLADEWSQLDEFTASRMYSLLQAIPDVSP